MLELVQRARALRQQARGDSTFRAYAAEAHGYVYFYLDRSDGEEPTLVKTDQVALEVYWKAPDSTKQRIVGLRDAERLPTNIRYHLDHLTVVQDEFQDVIRLGDGDEVAAVVHPAAPGAERVYDYRLADSITISFAGPQGSIRVYELEVRPKDFSSPGIVGSIFLARSDGAIVRMNFTFTPASYVDDYLDFIRISLDNSLWEGRFWLPYEQRVELRRELPFLDFPVGSVIRGRYRIRGYQFNPELPPRLFQSRAVSALPESDLRAFPFEQGLYEELDEEGLAPVPELAEIRAEAARLARGRYLSGLAGSRLWVPSVSDLLRYDRAEGLALGIGGSLHSSASLRLQVAAGYAFGRERPFAQFRLTRPDGRIRLQLRAYLHQPRDLGPRPTASGVVNTLATALFDEDYRDLFFASGASATLAFPQGDERRYELTATIAKLRSGRNTTSDSPTGSGSDAERPVLPIEDGTLVSLVGSWSSRPARGLRTIAEARVGRLDDRSFARLDLSGVFERQWLERGLDLRAATAGGWAGASAPPQWLYLLGGRGTLPGHPYRAFPGDRYLLFEVEGARDLAAPWVRLAALGSAGRTWLRGRELPVGWPTAANGMRYSAGVGARLLWDAVRLDLVRGLDGGKWELHFSAARRFRRWL